MWRNKVHMSLRLQWPTLVQARRGSWSSRQVRDAFIGYFRERDHAYVPSSSVVPQKGEGTYFVNAGMNQFKPIFLGSAAPGSSLASLKRAVNSQKCIRVGGKHNDLEDVGRDTYHHTFFEMLGSWSFGDYFKEEACAMAWELLTEGYGLPRERLYVTYFGGDQELGLASDEETKHIWLQIGVSPDRVLPFGASDNLWAMGDVGPCGPCTEIHYDHVVRPNAGHLVNAGSPDVVEIWNLVFMQYDRQPDGSLRRLPRQHVDTGMGLERLCAVMQGSTSNYDTDLFVPLFKQIEKICCAPAYGAVTWCPDVDVAYRLVADHARMCTVAIADGFLPGRLSDSQKRLRAIMQRAFKSAHQHLGAESGLVACLVPYIVESLGEAFPELAVNPEGVMDVINATEDRYWEIVKSGRSVMSRAVKKFGLKRGGVMSGEQIFAIMDGKFGQHVPLDVIRDLAEVYAVRLDVSDYERIVKEINEQKGVPPVPEPLALDQYDVIHLKQDGVHETDDSYKYALLSDAPSVVAKVTAVLTASGLSDSARPREKVAILLDKTNFYAEQGGQVSDTGTVELDNGAVFRVDDVQRFHDYVLHIGTLESGQLASGDTASLKPDQERRHGCTLNHTATHLLHYALTKVLGDAKQQGSTVYPDRLSFQYSSLKTAALSAKQLAAVSDAANQLIRDKLPLYTDVVPLATAKAVPGIRTLDGAVYSDTVRVVSVGAPVTEVLACPGNDWLLTTSVELCAGTHVRNTADIGPLVVTSVTGGQQGIKNVVAVTGEMAEQAVAKVAAIGERLEELRGYVNADVHDELWKGMVSQIETMLGKEQYLCKLGRDSIIKELEQLNRQMAPTWRGKRHLAAEVRRRLEEERDVPIIVHVWQLRRVRDVYECVVNEDFNIPLLLVVKEDKSVRAACYVPQNMAEWSDRWAEHVCGCIQGVRVTAPRGKHANDPRLRTVMTSEKSQDLLADDHVMERIKQFWTT